MEHDATFPRNLNKDKQYNMLLGAYLRYIMKQYVMHSIPLLLDVF